MLTNTLHFDDLKGITLQLNTSLFALLGVVALSAGIGLYCCFCTKEIDLMVLQQNPEQSAASRQKKAPGLNEALIQDRTTSHSDGSSLPEDAELGLNEGVVQKGKRSPSSDKLLLDLPIFRRLPRLTAGDDKRTAPVPNMWI